MISRHWTFDDHAPRHDAEAKAAQERGEKICRECGKPVTAPRRETWCSAECVAAYMKRARPVRGIVFERDNGVCVLCGESGGEWEADHIVPLVEGGDHSLDNTRTLCVPCHKIETALLRKRLKQPVKLAESPQDRIDRKRYGDQAQDIRVRRVVQGRLRRERVSRPSAWLGLRLASRRVV